MQFQELAPWIPLFNVNYHLGVDGISMPLILLNSFMTVLVVIAHWEVVTDKVGQYLAAFLIMSGLVNGTFAALDAILFYVFFEAMLIPMFLIIGVWGGPNRVYAAVKFFLYTLLGSLLMLAAFIYLYLQTNGSFEILDYHKLPLGDDGAGAGLPRDVHVLRGEGADVAGAHVAAGRARGGAHGRLGDPRGHHPQDRRATGSCASTCPSPPTPRTRSRAS